MPEIMIEPSQERQALHEARLETARQTVAQAQQELENAADEEERIIWKNRLEQRTQELEAIEAEEI